MSVGEQAAAVKLCGDARGDDVADQALLVGVKRLICDAHIERAACADTAPNEAQRVEKTAQVERLFGDLRVFACLQKKENMGFLVDFSGVCGGIL